MKLYLSSFRNGNKPKELIDLLGSDKKVAVISNARDQDIGKARQLAVNDEVKRLQSLGLTCTDIDLRSYFDKPEELKALLQDFGLLWVRGSNSFILRRAFRKSGLESFLAERIEKEKIVYGGVRLPLKSTHSLF